MKVALSFIAKLLPAGWKKHLIHALCDWAVKSTKTKLDDKLWTKIKDKI
jgi:hypothetical protein